MFTRKTKIALGKAILTRKSPVYVQFAVTKNCNLGCGMCASSVSRKAEKELSLAEIEKIADRLEKIRAGIILLTGGEPFLRPDISQIIRIFSEKGFTVRLQTNGTLATEENIRQACAAGMKEVTISLNSLDPQVHDSISGQSGSWDKTIACFSRFSRILPPQNTLLGINTVVCRRNLKELPQIIKFATRLGFYSSLIPIHVSATAADGEFIIRKEAPDFSFRKEDFSDLDRAYREIIAMKKNGYNIYNSYKFLRSSTRFLKGQRINWHCDSPDLYFAISPSGNFLPCADLNSEISLLDGNFVDLYRSGAFRSRIRKMVGNCKGCFYACWPEISFLCRDPRVLVERLLFGLQTSLSTRTSVTEEQCREIIKEIKEEKG